jgi:predicted transcriptional regulator of viral defense system
MPISGEIRFKVAKQDIFAFFEKLGKRVFSAEEIREILEEYRGFWRLPKSLSVFGFILLLIKEVKLKEIELNFPSSRVVRYTWGDVSIYELVLSLKQGSYLSHYSAVYLHDLTEQLPKTFYLNSELRDRPSSYGPLEQSRIDNAFKRPPRTSKSIAEYEQNKICLLHGMPTGQLGVIDTEGPDEQNVRVTDVERTLIDIAVRPFYAGGVFEVIKAYRIAKGKVSVNKLASYLKKMGFIYPYHQAIGFYLERSGVYDSSQIKLLRKFDMKFDFYLNYQMKEMAYSKEWRLYYPKGF